MKKLIVELNVTLMALTMSVPVSVMAEGSGPSNNSKDYSSCYAFYEAMAQQKGPKSFNKKDYDGRTVVDEWRVMPWVAPTLVAMLAINPVAAFAFPVPFWVRAGINGVADMPYNKMIKLLDQAKVFDQTGLPGPMLRRMHSQLDANTIDMKGFVKLLLDSDANGKLCAALPDFSKLKEDLNDGRLDLVELEGTPAPVTPKPIDSPRMGKKGCRVVSEPSDTIVDSSVIRNMTFRSLNRYGTQLISKGYLVSELPPDMEYDYAIQEDDVTTLYLSKVFGLPKERVDHFYRIVDSEGNRVGSVHLLTTRTRANVMIQGGSLPNRRRVGINKALRLIGRICSDR